MITKKKRGIRMFLFITSSPTGPLDGSRYCEGLDRLNNFVENLQKVCKSYMRALIITASPYDYEGNDHMCDFFREAFKKSGFSFSTFDLCDDRYVFDKEEIESYDLIILGGGHVPTQNNFFHQIHLRENLQDYQGIVLGISAGSMNMADLVYVQPEIQGESGDWFVKEAQGLGLEQIQLVPHYQMVKDYYLDGKKLFADIIDKDSFGRSIFLLEDGTYISNVDGCLKMYGKAYLLENGIYSLFCENNQTREIL